MRLVLIFLSILYLSSPWATTSLSAGQYNSKILRSKNYTEMRKLIRTYIKQSQSSLSEYGKDAAVFALKTGLKILFMRPDMDDGVKLALLPMIRDEIIQYNPFISVLQDIVEEAITGLKSKNEDIAQQASQLYVIENALSYLQAVETKESNAVLRQIQKAKIKLSKKLLSYLLLEMGRGKTASPSSLARRILKTRKEKLKRERKTKVEVS